jgi:hypothetical protein
MRIAKNESLKIRSFVLYTLCSMILLLYGCSSVTPPADYYQEVLEMEENGEQSRRDTGRQPGEVITPVKEAEPIRTAESSEDLLVEDESQPQVAETPVIEDKEEIKEEPPRREPVKEIPPVKTEPIAVAADVIKNALNAPEVNVGARTVELINGRLSGGKNSVRVSFVSESVDEIGNAFATICAVIYYINEESDNTIDVIEGIAEDQQSALLAILRSNISDVAEWMTQKVTKAEWYSKVTKKIL